MAKARKNHPLLRETWPRLRRINLRHAVEHEHPDIKVGRTKYLARIDGEWYFGRFSRQWYGLHFDCDFGCSGIQFDAPGSNESSWERLFEIQFRRPKHGG